MKEGQIVFKDGHSESVNCNFKPQAKRNTSYLTINTDHPSYVLFTAARGVRPFVVLTVVKGNFINAALYTRHDHLQTSLAKVTPCDSFASISKVELSASYHGFLYTPTITADCSPFTTMKYFHPTLLRVCTTLDSNLLEKNRQYGFRLSRRNKS